MGPRREQGMQFAFHYCPKYVFSPERGVGTAGRKDTERAARHCGHTDGENQNTFPAPQIWSKVKSGFGKHIRTYGGERGFKLQSCLWTEYLCG